MRLSPTSVAHEPGTTKRNTVTCINANWHNEEPVLPNQNIPDGMRPHVMCYYAGRDNFSVVLHSDIIEDLNIQVIKTPPFSL